jgi:hypothetical protein
MQHQVPEPDSLFTQLRKPQTCTEQTTLNHQQRLLQHHYPSSSLSLSTTFFFISLSEDARNFDFIVSKGGMTN